MSIPPITPRAVQQCPVCAAQLQSIGRLPVRRDAAQAHVILVASAPDPAGVVAIDVYRCSDCGRLEFYDHDFLLSSG